jgi:hypothetical protein
MSKATTPIPPGTLLTAVYAPAFPPFRIPPAEIIPWIGARLEWVAMGDNPLVAPGSPAFLLIGGGDGFGEYEGEEIEVPPLVVGAKALRGVKVKGEMKGDVS